MASRSFPLRQALKQILRSAGAHHSARSVHVCKYLFRRCTQAMSRLMATYQGVSWVCALGGSSWEGGALQSESALQFWHSHPLQTWGRANAVSLPLEWGDFFPFLLRARLALRVSEVWLSLSWQFQGSSSPSSGRKQLHTHWSDLLLIRGSKPSSFPSCFLACPLLKNSDCVLATTEMGTSKGGLEFAISGSVFLLTSQLLPVPVHCLLPLHWALDWLGYHFCALCGMALISISNCSFYFSKHMSSFQETWDSFL